MPFPGYEGEKAQMKYVLILIDRRSVNVYSASVKGEHYEQTSLFCRYYRDLPGTFMATLDISIVNVALPAIQHDLDAPMVSLQWLIDAYALCLSALILSAGPLSDRYGRKRCGWREY